MSFGKHIGWLIALLALTAHAFGQAPAVSEDYLLQKWDVDDGLPDNAITAITQTRDGYLWIGTQHGLARFDGVRFVNLPALATNHIQCLSEDKAGTLWIGTEDNTVLRYRDGLLTALLPVAKTQAPARNPHPDPLPSRRERGTNSLPSPPSFGGAESDETPLSCAAKGQDEGAKVSGTGNTRLTSLACDAVGAMWAGLADGRVLRWQVSRWEPVAGVTGTGAVTCQADAAGKIWFTTETSYGYFDGQRCVTLAADASFPQLVPRRTGNFWLARASLFPEIQVATEDRAGVLWIGTKGRGLLRYTDGSVRVPTSHNFITAICEDREGNLWVGTWGGGLNRLRPRRFRLHTEPGDMVYSIAQDTDGAMWFGTRENGVVRLADGQYTTFTTTNGWPGGVVTTLCADRNGGMWFGTLLNGLVRWQNGVFTGLVERASRPFESLARGRPALPTSGIESLCQTRDGQLWTGTTRNSRTAFAEDAAGTLWIGTRTGQLLRHTATGEQQFDAGGNAIQTILADKPDQLWVGTRGGGLRRFAQGRGERVAGLPDDDIRQIAADDAGNLWCGTLRGLFQLRGTNVVSYGRSEGLGSIEFVEGYYNATCRTRDGHLWFATRRGAVEVDPQELRAAAEPPPVHIESVSPREIRYTALSLTAPERIRFRYRLKNVATTWTDAGHERVAAFLGLPPGRYVFEVTARTSEGTWNPVSATAEFVVPAAWWQTLWFRLGVVIALIAGAAAVARFVAVRRMRQQLRLEEERARIAQDMHDELGARLTRIELLSEQARQEPTPARLEKISRTAHEVAQTLDEIVWTVNPRNDTLERLLGYLSEYATEYLANTGIELVQDLPENIPAFPLRSDARHNVLLAVKEALNNVVKHAAATRLELRVRLDDDRLQIQITDNGRGFAGENATGHGLENMRQRLTAVGGDCQVTSQPGQGTTVKLTLPVSNKDQRF